MLARSLSRLGIIAGAMLASTAAFAQVSDDIVKIGVLTDMNGPASTPTGQGSVTAAQMAIDDFGGTIAGGTLAEGRTAATSTLIALGLAFILLLERGPGREHIAIQSNMLGMVMGLGGVYAGILALPFLREFFELVLLGPGEWFLVFLSVAIGLTIASLLWKMPQIEALEMPEDA